MKKSVGEVAKFLLVSCVVGVIQLVLVNTLYFGLKGRSAPLPAFLRGIFSASAVGEGNDKWGYVLPFLISNAAANIYGYFQNRKTTFRAENVPKYCLGIYMAALAALILFSTWLQGVIVNHKKNWRGDHHKPFVISRKNFLFANTTNGAQSCAVLFSLIETAKENHLDPCRYLTWVLKEAPKRSASDPNWAQMLIPQNTPPDCR